MQIPDSLIHELRQDLIFRRIRRGIERISANRSLVDHIGPEQNNAAALLNSLAQWVDIGFDSPQLITQLLARFPRTMRPQMPLSEYIHLRMTEGFVAMTGEDFEEAIKHFEAALSLEDEIDNKELIAIANFSIGRCHRRVGRYRDALAFITRGKDLAVSLQYPVMAAVMQLVEAWIAFQEEKPDDARRILAKAEEVLSATDDRVSCGNIQSALGRIARRNGQYHQAVVHFERAIEEYGRLDPKHRNVARSLVNIASVKRLIALQLRDRIDNQAEQRRKNGKRKSAAVLPKHSRTSDRSSFERLHREALGHLVDARQRYARYHDHRGAGAVHINCGYLHLDRGDLVRAAAEGAAAYQLGAEKQDRILQARARILQSSVEGARFEEDVEEGSNSVHPAQAAGDYARDAVEFAKATQSRRLLAKAYLALAGTLSADFFNDAEAAHDCCEKAASLLSPQSHDYVWRDLQELRRKLLRSGKIDSTLRQWSHGIVGEKSFQRISDDFAAIVIPQVWKREGRKISRVAQRLSISPKKVRRILRDTGFLRSPSDTN